MIDLMETLLVAWGQEQVNPGMEVSIRSPLGHVDEAQPGVGGSRCLSQVETWVAQSKAAQAVGVALDALRERDATGRVLVGLAEVRYCHEPRWPVAEQCGRLGISVRTYRSRVDELHVVLAAAVPAVAQQLVRADCQTAAHKAALARMRAAKEAAKSAAREGKRKAAARKAFARSVHLAAAGV